MLFDANIQIMDMEFVSVDEHVQVVLQLALGLPMPQGVLPIPAGVIRFGMSKDSAIEKFKEAIEVAEGVPDPKPESDLVIANSLAGVEKAVQIDQSLKGK